MMLKGFPSRIQIFAFIRLFILVLKFKNTTNNFKVFHSQAHDIIS